MVRAFLQMKNALSKWESDGRKFLILLGSIWLSPLQHLQDERAPCGVSPWPSCVRSKYTGWKRRALELVTIPMIAYRFFLLKVPSLCCGLTLPYHWRKFLSYLVQSGFHLCSTFKMNELHVVVSPWPSWVSPWPSCVRSKYTGWKRRALELVYIFMRYILLVVFTWFAFSLKEVLKHKQFSRSDIALCYTDLFLKPRLAWLWPR